MRLDLSKPCVYNTERASIGSRPRQAGQSSPGLEAQSLMRAMRGDGSEEKRRQQVKRGSSAKD
jgi:hypothetical protein